VKSTRYLSIFLILAAALLGSACVRKVNVNELLPVSQAIPTIHPYIRISPDGIPGHSREFAEWAKSPLARTGMVAAAKALAMTALDLVARPEELAKAKREFAG